jgi:hypothetical protein
MFLFESFKERDEAQEVNDEVKHIDVKERVGIGSIYCPPAKVNFAFFLPYSPSNHATLRMHRGKGGRRGARNPRVERLIRSGSSQPQDLIFNPGKRLAASSATIRAVTAFVKSGR